MALELQLRAAFARSVRDVEAANETGGDPSHKLLRAQNGKRGLEVAFRLLRKARAQVRMPKSLLRVGHPFLQKMIHLITQNHLYPAKRFFPVKCEP